MKRMKVHVLCEAIATLRQMNTLCDAPSIYLKPLTKSSIRKDGTPREFFMLFTKNTHQKLQELGALVTELRQLALFLQIFSQELDTVKSLKSRGRGIRGHSRFWINVFVNCNPKRDRKDPHALTVVGGRRGRAKKKQGGEVGKSVKKKGTIGAPIYCRVMLIFSLFHA